MKNLLSSLFFLAIPAMFLGQDLSMAAYAIPDSLFSKSAHEIVREDSRYLLFKSPGEAELKRRLVVTVLDDEASSRLQYIRYDDQSKVRKASARLYDGMGHLLREVGKDEWGDESAISSGELYSDDRVRSVELVHTQFPYTIELEYELQLSQFSVFKQLLWPIQGYGQAIESASFELEVPAELSMEAHPLNISLAPLVTAGKNGIHYHYQAKNLPAVAYEPLAPPAAQVLPSVLFIPGHLQIDDRYAGDLRSWQSFGKLMYQLFEGRDELPVDWQEKVQNLTATISNDREKIEILYRLLQDNMRYVSVQLGIGGWQPFDAVYVAENKFGDCKALTNFMMALLRQSGIQSHPVLIYRGPHSSFHLTDSFANPFAFNHVLLHVPKEDVWLECTSNEYPVNYIGSDNEGRRALLIREDGGHLIDMPRTPAAENRIEWNAEIELQAGGQALIKGRTTYLGTPHQDYRQYKHYWSIEKQKQEFQRTVDLPAFVLKTYELNASPERPEAWIDYEADVSRYASQAGKRLFVPLNLLDPQTQVLPELAERRLPIDFRYGLTLIDSLTFHLPEGHHIESYPQETIQLEAPIGNYQLRVEVGEEQVLYYRRLEYRPGKLPPEGYEGLRSFFKEMAKAERQMMVLVNKT